MPTIETNSSYFIYTTSTIPLSATYPPSVTGLMALLSVMQYQAPYMSPTYSGAAQQAGHAAFIVSGGQAFQDKATAMATKTGEDAIKSAVNFVGLVSEQQLGLALGVAKVIRDGRIDIEGPKVYDATTHISADPSDASVGFTWRIK